MKNLPSCRQRLRSAVLGAVLALLAAPSLVPSAHAAVFYPESFTLANGLQIVVVPNHLSPTVAQMVWYKVGAADEAPGHSGLAHYLEHLMFRGTRNIPAGQFSPIIAAQGGGDNAFTSHDYTAYHEVAAADRLGLLMLLEADRMQNLAITPATATPELGVVLNERQERTDNSPQGKFAERVQHALFGATPYGTPIIGWKAEMEKMTPEAATTFYQEHYAPNNAVVVISGNVEPREVLRLATATYGRVPRRDVAPRRALALPGAPLEKTVIMSDPGVEQPMLQMQILAPSYTRQLQEAHALEVLSEALAGGEVGTLYRDLVIRQKIAASLDIDYDPQTRGAAVFAIYATPQPGRTAQALAEALDASLSKLAGQGLEAATIKAAKERLTRSAVFARDSLLAPGYAFGMALTTGGKIRDVESWPAHIEAVTVAHVNKALRKLAASPQRVTAQLLPDPNATPEARAKALDAVPSHEMGIR